VFVQTFIIASANRFKKKPKTPPQTNQTKQQISRCTEFDINCSLEIYLLA